MENGNDPQLMARQSGKLKELLFPTLSKDVNLETVILLLTFNIVDMSFRYSLG
jgi:hypothetical protein